MSVDIDWEKLTKGPEGARLAESIRNFVHERFQQVPLPRFIRSVKVLSFEFGEEAPEVEVKDICDPLHDFYEDSGTEAGSDVSDAGEVTHDLPNERTAPQSTNSDAAVNQLDTSRTSGHARKETIPATQQPRPTIPKSIAVDRSGKPLSPALFTPQQSSAIPGGTSSLTYFHLPYGAGISGPTTPLATMAGAHFQSGWPESGPTSYSRQRTSHQHSASISSETPSSPADPTSRPSSQHRPNSMGEGDTSVPLDFASISQTQSIPDRSPNDLQVVAHVRYCGDLSLILTAEIFLDYPMPSFAAIPLQLHITGFTFDGVAILAYIKRKVHCCFLSPEDADMFLGADSLASENDGEARAYQRPLGGLLEEVRVESEIGQKENGKQVLKNVGKVEKFVLEQVQRIFEDEFVFPSFWTFLV